MGLNDSKPERLSKEERVSRDTAKANMVNQRKKDIIDMQRQAIGSIREVENVGNIGNVENVERSNQISLGNKDTNITDIYTFLHVTEKAKSQLERDGASLVKADLIAILIALEPSLRSSMRKMDEMRVTDLNSMIRSIIYDPNRIVSSMSSMSSISSMSSTSSTSSTSSKNKQMISLE